MTTYYVTTHTFPDNTLAKGTDVYSEFLAIQSAFASVDSTFNNYGSAVNLYNKLHLGAKSSAPTVDNSGGALQTGADYFDTTTNRIGVWNGTAWVYDSLDSYNSKVAAAASASAAATSASAAATIVSTFPSITSANAGQSLLINSTGTAYLADSAAKGFRNKIINGDFQIWQGGTSFTNPTNASTSFCADDWQYNRTSYTSGITASKQTVNGLPALKVQRTAGDTSTANLYLSKSFESIEIAKFAGKTVTLSLKIQKGGNFSSTSNLLGIVSQYGTGVESSILTAGFTGGGTIYNTPITLNAAQTLYQLQIAVPASATQFGTYFTYTPTGTAGADDSFTITDVQLEEGSVATPFERKPYSIELSLCQRYYQTYTVFVSQSSTSKTTFPINMRTTPTIGGGGAGFTSTGTTADALHCYQTTGAVQTLTLSARL
jgi:hypothetical protein